MFNWGMSTAGLQLDSAHPTGEVRVSLQNGQPSFDIVADRAYDHIGDDPLPPLDPALIYHGSLALRQTQSAIALEALLERYQAPVFLDVNLRPPWWEHKQLSQLLDHTRWLKINDDELHTLLEGPETLVQKAANLIDMHHLTTIIVTQGALGAFAISTDGSSTKVTPRGKSRVVDTVGAGDAFASVCITGLLQEWPLKQTLERAQQFASLVVAQRGATAHDPDLYAPLIREWNLDT
jgi:fructokinase